jgi:hypothetical protein
MKMILIITAATVIFCGAIGPIACSNSPSDPSEIKQEKANEIMIQTYGANWFEVYRGCVKTNRNLSKTMTATYESAIGYHRAK